MNGQKLLLREINVYRYGTLVPVMVDGDHADKRAERHTLSLLKAPGNATCIDTGLSSLNVPHIASRIKMTELCR